MKVLQVIPSIAAQAGGPSEAILPLCRALSAQGIDLLLATTDAGLTPHNGMARLQYGEVTDYQGQPTIFFPSQLGASFKYSRPFAQWLETHVAEFDLVHIHAVFNHACIAAARACRRKDVPYVIRPLGTLSPWAMKQKSWRKRAFWQAGVKRMLNGAAAIQYTARVEQEATEGLLGLNHGFVVPLGVDPPPPRPASRQLLSESFPALVRNPYVLLLARLLPTKGVDVLLEAFLSLVSQSQFAEWRLVLAGEGPAEYVTKLKRVVAEGSAADHVLFPGWLSGETKETVLQNASLLALPSYHENFGLCVLEALACGVPVLVSPQVNLAAEVATAGAGWVAPIDKAAIAAALAGAMASESERRRRGDAGRSLASGYAWPSIAVKLHEVYREVLAARPTFTTSAAR
jgi:glycosyltransferase involved in cell wall biosynthesis